MGKLQFYWRYFGNIQKAIIGACAAMSPVSDFVPDSWKHHFLPDWSWQTWLVVAMVCLLAFVLEEAHHRHLTQEAARNSVAAPEKKNTAAYIAIAIIVVAAGITVLWGNQKVLPQPVAGTATPSLGPPTTPSPQPAPAPAPTKPRITSRRIIPATVPIQAAQTTTQPIQTVNVDQGIGGIGGTYINPTVNNNGPPPLKVTWRDGGTIIQVDEGTAMATYVRVIYVTPNVQWQPISLTITADQEIEEAGPVMIGYNPSMCRPDPRDKKTYHLYYTSPGAGANTELQLRVVSRKPFSVLNVVLAQ